MKKIFAKIATKSIFIFCILFSIESYSQNIDYSLIPYRKGDKWGFVNANKTIIISATYDDVKWFTEGMAAVKLGSKWGYINTAGKMLIPAKFTVAKSFRKGYIPLTNKVEGDTILFAGASTVESGYEGCINIKGERLAKCPAIAENVMVSNRIPMETVVKEKVYSISNSNGLFDKIVDDYKIAGNEETFYVAQKGGLFGVFNSKFEAIIPFEYNTIKAIKSENKTYLHVTKSEMNGLINEDGSFSILPVYYSLVLFKGINEKDFVIVKKNGKAFVKDLNNREIIASGFSEILYDENGGFILIDENNLYGFYYPNTPMITPKYADIRITNKGSDYLQIKTTKGKVGYINSQGVEFFEE
jgi:WG containing repeat